MAPRNRSRDDDRDDDREDDRRDRRTRDRDDDDRGGRERSRDRGRDSDDEEDRGSRRRSTEYEYAGRSSEENTQRAKQGSARYDSFLNTEVVWYSPKIGENQIRIIPWLNKKFDDFAKLKEKYGSHWGIDAVIHRNVGADNGTYLCLDKTLGEPCPVCDAWRDDDEEKLKPSDRILCWVIDRNEQKAGPKLWNMPLGTSKDIQAASQDRQSGEWYNVEHPDEGYDIYFDREGEKARTRYKQFELAKKPSPLHTDADKMDKWLAYVMEKPLPEYLKTYDVEKLEKVLSGQRSSRDDDEDGDRSDRRRSWDDDDRGSERSSRRRGSDDDGDNDRGSRRSSSRDDDDRGSSRRRGRGEEEEAEEIRPSRRRGRDEEDPEPEERAERGSRGRREEKDDDGGGRSRRRSEPEADPEKEEEPPPRRNSRASSKAKDEDKGGKVERHRPKDEEETEKEDDDDGGDDRDDDRESAKENLKRVGRRTGK